MTQIPNPAEGGCQIIKMNVIALNTASGSGGNAGI
jgi:hypothetical protein